MNRTLRSQIFAIAIAAALAATVTAGGSLAASAATDETKPTVPPGAVSIDADQGIEWQRRAQVVIARGNARAVRGDMQLTGQVLTAHFRDQPNGSSEVWKIDAEGGVRLTTPNEAAYGERGSFNLDTDVLTLSGGEEVGVTTAGSRITARRQITYNTRTRTLVATGDAVAIEGDRTLSGEVITVVLREAPAEGQSRMLRLEAEGNVRLITGSDDIRADRGTYDVDSGRTTMNGSVKIVRGRNVLTGCRGEANLKTGVSTLFACPDERRGGTRVQGIILPQAAKPQ